MISFKNTIYKWKHGEVYVIPIEYTQYSDSKIIYKIVKNTEPLFLASEGGASEHWDGRHRSLTLSRSKKGFLKNFEPWLYNGLFKLDDNYLIIRQITEKLISYERYSYFSTRLEKSKVTLNTNANVPFFGKKIERIYNRNITYPQLIYNRIDHTLLFMCEEDEYYVRYVGFLSKRWLKILFNEEIISSLQFVAFNNGQLFKSKV